MTPLYPQKLALTSPTSGSRSVHIVCSQTKAAELVITKYFLDYSLQDFKHNMQVHLFMTTEQGMNKLPIQDTGAIGSWGKKPKYQDHLDLIIEWQPVTKYLSSQFNLRKIML
jgi:hypothetical protein